VRIIRSFLRTNHELPRLIHSSEWTVHSLLWIIHESTRTVHSCPNFSLFALLLSRRTILRCRGNVPGRFRLSLTRSGDTLATNQATPTPGSSCPCCQCMPSFRLAKRQRRSRTGRAFRQGLPRKRLHDSTSRLWTEPPAMLSSAQLMLLSDQLVAFAFESGDPVPIEPEHCDALVLTIARQQR
jgi:hypothetical protein